MFTLSRLALDRWKARDIIFEKPQLGIMLQAGISPVAVLAWPASNSKDLLASTDTQGRHFKDNLRQYNAAFVFTSLGCDIVSAEDRANNNNNRGGLNAFQIHAHFAIVKAPWLQLKAVSLPTPSCISLTLLMLLKENKHETTTWILRSLGSFQLYLINAIPLRVYIAMHMRYWAIMKTKLMYRTLLSVHSWERAWSKEVTDVFRICQQWKKFLQSSLLSIVTEASVTSFLLWEAAVEMIVSIKGMFLSSTFNASARHMLHTCSRIMYIYFIMEHMGVIRVYVSSFPYLLLLLQSLFLVFRWWFMAIVCRFIILIPSLL